MKPIRLRYQTFEIDRFDIHIRSLRDRQQFSDPLGEAEAMGISSAQWPLFGVVWASSEVLANEMADFAIQGKRILEIGCGMALTSLVLNSRNADITATDVHPEAGKFLEQNVKLNRGDDIPFLRADWHDTCDGLGRFDLLVGSDLLYERQHVGLLSSFIEQHAKPNCEIVIVDPGRSNHAPFSKKMSALGYAHSQRSYDGDDLVSGKFKGQILQYLR